MLASAVGCSAAPAEPAVSHHVKADGGGNAPANSIDNATALLDAVEATSLQEQSYVTNTDPTADAAPASSSELADLNSTAQAAAKYDADEKLTKAQVDQLAASAEHPGQTAAQQKASHKALAQEMTQLAADTAATDLAQAANLAAQALAFLPNHPTDKATQDLEKQLQAQIDANNVAAADLADDGKPQTASELADAEEKATDGIGNAQATINLITNSLPKVIAQSSAAKAITGKASAAFAKLTSGAGAIGKALGTAKSKISSLTSTISGWFGGK